MKLIVRGGRVLCGEPAEERSCDVVMEKGLITSLDHAAAAPGDKVINAENKLVLPGLVDLHTHYISRNSAGFLMLARAGVTTALDALVGNGMVASEYIYNKYRNTITCGVFLQYGFGDNTITKIYYCSTIFFSKSIF